VCCFHDETKQGNRLKRNYYQYVHEQECTDVQKVHIVYPSLLGNEEEAAMLEALLRHDAELTHQLVFASPSAFS
jgi:hypothetical protein